MSGDAMKVRQVLNTDRVKDTWGNINRLGDDLVDRVIGARWRYRASAGISLASGATWPAGTFTLNTPLLDELWPLYGANATATYDGTGFKAPAAGRYVIEARCRFAAGGGTYRGLAVTVNSATPDQFNYLLYPAANISLVLPYRVELDLATGDHVWFAVQHNAGAALTVDAAQMTVRRTK